MPTSNGQVTGRDIRQKAIKQSHVFPAAIDTTELAGLAVTVDKTDDPQFVGVGESDRFHDVSLTTTLTERASFTVTIPSWVGQIFVLAIGGAQFTNSSGSTQSIIAEVTINGDPSITTGTQQGIPTGITASVTDVAVAAVATPGSTVTIGVNVKVSPGTNSSNNGEVHAIVTGTR